MELPDLSTLLPPGFLGLGSAIPILIGQNPFTEDARAKPLLATTMVLMVWMVWLCSSILFHIFLYSQNWSIMAVLVAIVCLALLLYGMIFPKKAAAADQAEILATRARKNAALLYIAAIFSTAVAASILLAMKDWVVIEVKLDGPPAAVYEEVSFRKTGDLDAPVMQPRYRRVVLANALRVVVSQKDFDNKPEWDYLCFITPATSNGSKKHLYLERAKLSQVIMPGAGVFMEGTPTDQKPSPPSAHP